LSNAAALDAPADATRRGMSVSAGLAALGIVYGDLGTSPLYTMPAVLSALPHPDARAALGILSLIVWSLIITISVKYCVLVMRADNHGEGGILALMTLIGADGDRRRWLLVAMGLFGAALIYGDGIITPAISVLSAVEGVNIATDALKPYVLPIAAAILVALFAAQSFGTARIGRVFGPVMLLWFAVAAALGLLAVLRRPEVLAALNPAHAVGFLAHQGWRGFGVLGGVFLAITGGEALYADMGHVGRLPIRASWYGIVLPALLLNYAGQTALLLDNPEPGGSLFFRLAPNWAVIPLVLLATAATVIASQAIISGAFSLTRQAMQLGWLPGLVVRQTSEDAYGQVYVPFVNWIMMGFTLALALSFGSSDRLAGAYGTAVSTTMLLTTALLYFAMREQWKWPAALALLVTAGFLLVDAAFFAANLLKIVEGGWIPLLAGALLYVVMTTWRHGTDAIRQRVVPLSDKPERFLQRLREGKIPRVPGSAVFLTRNQRPVPLIMVRHIQEMGALHEGLVSLTVQFEQVPRIPRSQRVQVEAVSDGFWHMTVHWGFMDRPDLSAALACAQEQGCTVDFDHALFFGGHDEVRASGDDRLLPFWRRMLFAFLYRNAVRTVDRFNLPPERFIEVGRHVEL
jgi:KUP system potassium uptake protein